MQPLVLVRVYSYWLGERMSSVGRWLIVYCILVSG